MKNKVYNLTHIILPMVMMLALFSCKKYLQTNNPANISQTDVFNSVSYSNSAVVGVYAMLIGDNGYGNRISCLYPQSGDDFRTSGSYSADDRRGISMFGAAPSNSELQAPFSQLYKGIDRANICIKYIASSTLYNNGSASDKVSMQKLLGESLTLRAQFYYELVIYLFLPALLLMPPIYIYQNQVQILFMIIFLMI